MRFEIPSETFIRMSKAAARPHDPRQSLACVRLEINNGRKYAIASTSYVIAVEYLGKTDGPNEAVNVPISIIPLIDPSKKEIAFEYYPDFKVLLFEGQSVPICDTEHLPLFTRWFDLFPKKPDTNRGFLYIDNDAFRPLIDASPSGQLTFADVLDSYRVTIVRDAIDANWCGAFVPLANEKKYTAATRPEWMP